MREEYVCHFGSEHPLSYRSPFPLMIIITLPFVIVGAISKVHPS